MIDAELQYVLNQLYEAEVPDKADIELALNLREQTQISRLYEFADDVRRRHVGDGILLRGIVEFSNRCGNACAYCGLNRNNTKLQRYHLTTDELLDSVKLIAEQGIKTIVLQSGENTDLDINWLAEAILEIKRRYDMAITLCVGERSIDDYRLWKQAGADRYLLKIETTSAELYGSLHPEMSFQNRLRCLEDLRMLGYQVGSGNIIGLPGQTTAHIAEDILFFAKGSFDMLGIGPLIPHPATPLSDSPIGNIELVLKTVAVTRIVTKDAHLPATTAVGSVNGNDYRQLALMAGANVMMPNFTPMPYRLLYEIYPGKRCVTETPGLCGPCLDTMARAIGRTIDYSRGDSLKKKNRQCA